MSERTSPRSAALDAAREAVEDRDSNHGDPSENFGVIADLWSSYLDMDIDPHQVAELMILLKVARSKNGRPAFDHHVDVCGYGTLAATLSPEHNGGEQADE